MAGRIYIGTAGWSIPKAAATRCPGDGSHLERYARTFQGAEINSSFYRSHAASTYAKWAASTDTDLRFTVKVPRTITHEQKLRRSRTPFRRFLSETSGLGVRRGPLLVQLPPSLAFDRRVASRFFALVRSEYDGLVVCEPRHPSWFSSGGDALLCRYEVARVAADPPPVGGTLSPGGWPGLAYFRLHGSPRMYWSRYDTGCLVRLAGMVQRISESTAVWCVFDNTASGAALDNAWDVQRLLR